MRTFRLVATLLCCVIVFALLSLPVGDLPPLGGFLNPFAGFWTNSRAQDVLPTSLDLPGLRDDVEILWDKRRVPHVFAKNVHDLYLAQGYVVARDRLWQMDFQARAAAGRLSEILGPKAVEFDKFRRRIGLALAAERSLDRIMENPESRLAVEAFTAGVNAWIGALNPSSLPVEYKILDYEPEPWAPLNSALLLKSMSYTLTFGNSEAAMSRAAEYLEIGLLGQLYPERSPGVEPAIPAGTRWRFVPLHLDAVTRHDHSHRPIVPGITVWPDHAAETRSGENDGSNTWALSGNKTLSGYPILCSDPHLSLTLPSIWYEMQLTAPGVNVYGVTIPGSPGVIIGFNADIAWGTANAGSDVLDWYVLTFRDSTRLEYKYGAAWKPVSARIEAIAVRGSETILDTVLVTHYGPVVRLGTETARNHTIPPDAALRWTAHDASNELLAFLGINTATNQEMFLKAVAHVDNPAQNFVYAVRSGDIGMIHAGKFPLRRHGQGRYLSNGADPQDEWAGWIPREHLPQVLNPKRGFVGSANQPPTDGHYPYYLGSEYASSERARRIHDVLGKLDHITPEMMISLQSDVYSIQAGALLPVLVAVVRRCNPGEGERDLLREMESWSGEYQRELYGPTVFEEWWAELNTGIWHDDVERDSLSLRWPRRDVTTAMILDGSIGRFADDRTTPEKEQWEDIVCQSFHRASSSLRARLGPLGHAWQWGYARGSSIPHLAGLPGLGRKSLKTGGSANVINATTSSSGPSWRMVVELGPEPRAWGIYPGGQSGNPGSDAYDDCLSDWIRGLTYELAYLTSPSDSAQTIVHRTLFRRSP